MKIYIVSFLTCLFIFMFYGCKPNKARHFMVENVCMNRVLVNGIDSGAPLYMLSIQLKLCDEYFAFPINSPFNEGIKDTIEYIKALSATHDEKSTLEGISSYKGKNFAALWLNKRNNKDAFQVYYSASMKDLQDELNNMRIFLTSSLWLRHHIAHNENQRVTLFFRVVLGGASKKCVPLHHVCT